MQILDVALITESWERWKLLNRVLGAPPKLRIKEAPKMKLKDLPTHLKYSFICEDNTLLVILSAALSDEQVEAALMILKKRKATLGWQM